LTESSWTESLHWVKRLGPYALLWFALWGSIFSGPWPIIGEKAGLLAWINAMRASVPLALLVLWVLLMPVRVGPARKRSGPEVLWTLYALVMFVAALHTDRWFVWGYWALAYLSVFAAIDLTLAGAVVTRAQDMVRFNWLMATLILVAMLFLARDMLLVEGKTGLTAYGLDQRARFVAGVPVSKTSGLARMAIVPAVVGFVLMLQSAGVRRFLWAGVGLAAVVMIWFFQARQGIFGTIFALGFVMLLIGGRMRALGVVVTSVIGLFLFAGALPENVVDYVVEHATRGEGGEAFESMTGRDEIWRRGWRIVEEAPWIGYGPQADRRFIFFNASNGLLYAAMCAGYIGLLLYLGGLVWGWVLYARAFRDRAALSSSSRAFLLQVGGIMAYLTIRNYPENAASFYSVDLILHATMLAYLGVLDRARRRRPSGRRMRGRGGPVGLPDGRMA
jgi:O-antigen ligase